MKEKEKAKAESAPEQDEEAPQALPPLDFSTFILSLASTAMVHLGHHAAPDQSAPARDLPAAKQVIDMLQMLADKTRGNLDDAEDKLLRSVLYDLRVSFVDASKAT